MGCFENEKNNFQPFLKQMIPNQYKEVSRTDTSPFFKGESSLFEHSKQGAGQL